MNVICDNIAFGLLQFHNGDTGEAKKYQSPWVTYWIISNWVSNKYNQFSAFPHISSFILFCYLSWKYKSKYNMTSLIRFQLLMAMFRYTYLWVELFLNQQKNICCGCRCCCCSCLCMACACRGFFVFVAIRIVLLSAAGLKTIPSAPPSLILIPSQNRTWNVSWIDWCIATKENSYNLFFHLIPTRV